MKKNTIIFFINIRYLVIIFVIILHLQKANIYSIEATQKELQCHGLASLEIQVQKELKMLNIPAPSWLPSAQTSEGEVLDVAIIGGGMGGLSISLALIKEGISNIKIYDQNACGREGPWLRYARMNFLRSGKTDLGPALGIPSLTFWAWYEAQYGQEAWDKLKFAPTPLWNSYLCWFKSTLGLPIENNITLINIIPSQDNLKLIFEKEGVEKIVYAHKVVLATGRDGAGKPTIPHFMENLSPDFFAHTAEQIDNELYANKNIAIIGGGASAFDAAATALESGANKIDMLIRRKGLPAHDKLSPFIQPGSAQGFFHLSDQERWLSFELWLKLGTPPPQETLQRVKNYQNLNVNYNTYVLNIQKNDDSITISTNHGDFNVDFIILGTGFCVDLSQRKELTNIHNDILLWKECVSDELRNSNCTIGQFPYLGPHYEFLESNPGNAPYLKNIYCFNYGAFLSHGLLSGDIGLNSLGAARLVEGIVIDFFLKNYINNLSKKSNFM